jgi:hypothetical protein
MKTKLQEIIQRARDIKQDHHYMSATSIEVEVASIKDKLRKVEETLNDIKGSITSKDSKEILAAIQAASDMFSEATTAVAEAEDVIDMHFGAIVRW